MFNTGLIWGVSWVWYLLGTLGIGGLILLATLAPTGLAVIWRVLMLVLNTRIGCALLAGGLMFMVADIHRSRKDAAEWARQKAAFEAQQDARDKRIAAETTEAVKKQLADEAVVNTQIDQNLKDFHDALPVPHTESATIAADNPFRVGDAACRLRVIAGGPPCGESKAGPVKLPKARPKAAGSGNHIGH